MPYPHRIRPTPAPIRKSRTVSLALPILLPAFLPILSQAGSRTPAGLEPFAVVELFTSEGCSSCPPADKLLSRLAERSDRGGRRIFALSFHVDYWNYLGWKDPFSRAGFTARQRDYADVLSARVYTPQMIVNGKVEFVGSDASRAEKSLDAALAAKAVASIRLEAFSEASPGSIRIAVRVENHRRGDLLNVALVERDVSIAVRRGENGGRTLRHDNVVRSFRSIGLDAGGVESFSLACPAGTETGRLSVIAYVQEVPTLGITGAVSIAWPRPE